MLQTSALAHLFLLVFVACAQAPQSQPPSPTQDEPSHGGDHVGQFRLSYLLKAKKSTSSDLCIAPPKGYGFVAGSLCEGELSTLRAPTILDVAYGDFDGDGQMDSIGELRHKTTGKPKTFIWFGGDSQPRPFSSLAIVTPPSKSQIFTDETLDAYFRKAKGKVVPDEDPDNFFDSMTMVHYGGVPGEEFGIVHTFRLNRSIFYRMFLDVMIIEIYIIDKSRTKVLVEVDSNG